MAANSLATFVGALYTSIVNIEPDLRSSCHVKSLWVHAPVNELTPIAIASIFTKDLKGLKSHSKCHFYAPELGVPIS